MIGLRRWAPVLVVVAVVLLVTAAGLGFGALQEMYGPPMRVSGGTFGTAFSPDGRTVAVIDPSLEVWDVADRAHPKLADYSHGDDIVGGADPAFSPDGRVLATGGGAVTLWNVADPARLTQIAVLPAYHGGVNGQVNAVAFSPDGQLLASGSDGGTVVLRNIADPAAPVITATLHFTIAPPRFPGIATGPDVALAFSASGRTLTTIADNTTVILWNVINPGAVSRITTIADNSIGAGKVAFSPDGASWPGRPPPATRWPCGRLP